MIDLLRCGPDVSSDNIRTSKVNKNQKLDPLRTMKTFIRRKVGHTT